MLCSVVIITSPKFHANIAEKSHIYKKPVVWSLSMRLSGFSYIYILLVALLHLFLSSLWVKHAHFGLQWLSYK